jgi:hypothetical protein
VGEMPRNPPPGFPVRTLDMSPTLPVPDSANVWWANAKLFCELALGFTKTIFPDFKYILFRQFTLRQLFSSTQSIFRESVLRIVFMRSQKQMIGIYAFCIIALMTDQYTTWKNPIVENLPRYSVRQQSVAAFSRPDHAVALTVQTFGVPT